MRGGEGCPGDLDLSALVGDCEGRHLLRGCGEFDGRAGGRNWAFSVDVVCSDCEGVVAAGEEGVGGAIDGLALRKT